MTVLPSAVRSQRYPSLDRRVPTAEARAVPGYATAPLVRFYRKKVTLRQGCFEVKGQSGCASPSSFQRWYLLSDQTPGRQCRSPFCAEGNRSLPLAKCAKARPFRSPASERCALTRRFERAAQLSDRTSQWRAVIEKVFATGWQNILVGPYLRPRAPHSHATPIAALARTGAI